jgi:hypothetical protein
LTRSHDPSKSSKKARRKRQLPIATELEEAMIQRNLISGLVLMALAGTASADSKIESIEYYDDTTLWVLGQVARTTVTSGTGTVEASRTEFGWMALPTKIYNFGKLQQTLAYDMSGVLGKRGTLLTVTDGRTNPTTLSHWKRGIPQTINFADETARFADVDDLGQIRAVVDESGAMTCYGYDPMGRISQVTQPSETNPAVCDTSSSEKTVITFNAAETENYGLPIGHWVQTTHTGSGYKEVHFDALWRPVVVETYDSDYGSSASNGTRSITVTRYDTDGRVIYQSYPTRTLSSYVTSNQGTWTWYDTLGRPTRIKQDDGSTTGLVTTIDYLPGFQRRTTDPRVYATTESFQTFDEPTFSAPIRIDAPEDTRTTIDRDVFGKPTTLTKQSSL